MFPIELANSDPATVAMAALLAAKAIEGAGGELGRTGVDLLHRAGSAIWRRFRDDAEATAALQSVEAAPDDEDAVRLLASVMAMRAQDDPSFGDEVADLVARAERLGLIRRTAAQGGISANKIVQRGRRNTIVGGDQINYPPNR